MKKLFLMSIFLGTALLASASVVQAGQNQKQEDSSLNTTVRRALLAGATWMAYFFLQGLLPEETPADARKLCGQWASFLIVDACFSDKPVVTNLTDPGTLGRVAVVTGLGVATNYATHHTTFSDTVNTASSILAIKILKSENPVQMLKNPLPIATRVAVTAGVIALGEKAPQGDLTTMLTFGLALDTMASEKPVYSEILEVFQIKNSYTRFQ